MFAGKIHLFNFSMVQAFLFVFTYSLMVEGGEIHARVGQKPKTAFSYTVTPKTLT